MSDPTYEHQRHYENMDPATAEINRLRTRLAQAEAQVENMKAIMRETGVLAPAAPRRSYGYDVGQWVTTNKYGKMFDLLGWGRTEDEALAEAKATLDRGESRG